MKKIICDYDDVVFTNGFKNMINKFLGTNYVDADFEGYLLQDMIPEQHLKSFYRFLITKNMYNYVDEVEEAIESLKEINKYYELYVCSSYHIYGNDKKYGKFLRDKYEHIEKHLNFLKSPSQQIILMSNKKFLAGDIIIDDVLNNLEGNFETKLLFSTIANGKINNNILLDKKITRVNGWKDVRELLLK